MKQSDCNRFSSLSLSRNPPNIVWLSLSLSPVYKVVRVFVHPARCKYLTLYLSTILKHLFFTRDHRTAYYHYHYYFWSFDCKFRIPVIIKSKDT